ncbi:DJ-1/PfpI family protein [Candidatus Sumerlaeota bacterium]|nr:DJ-1/PfpI family protein [Candidatus Sumerlaeota bacterium]
MKRVLIPLIDGFEEIEAIACIDILRRAGIDVITAGIGKKTATGSHQITVSTDTTLDEASSQTHNLILLPGGPGTGALGEVPTLQGLLKRQAAADRPIAAICAAPTILAKHGLLEGKRATCFPAVEAQMAGAELSHYPVVIDGQIITSRGAGTAIPFALAVVEHLLGREKSQALAREIVYQ